MKVVFAALSAMAISAPAYAQLDYAERGGRAGPPDFIALGVGVTTDYLGSDDFRPIPFGGAKVSVPGADLYWRGLGVRADILSPLTGGRFIGGLDARFQFGRDSDVDSVAVAALPEIDDTVEVGGFVGYRIFGLAGPRDSLTFSVDALFDAGGAHDGFAIQPGVTYSTPLSDKLRANISVNTEYGSENFMETYFDVTPEGALASGLPVYAAEDGVVYQVGSTLGLNYSLTERWGVFGLVSYRRLIGDAADSPIVAIEGDENQFLGGLSLSYQF